VTLEALVVVTERKSLYFHKYLLR